MSDFTALLDELAQLQAGNTDMAKALRADEAADDKKIVAAADTDGDGKAEGIAEGEGEGDDAEGKDGQDKGADYFGKAMQVTLPDGTVTEAYDGSEAIAGIHARIDALTEQVNARAAGDDMLKALSGTRDVLKGMQDLISKQSATIASQGEMLKSMQADIGSLRNSGAGRKATLSVHDKPTAATQAAPSGPTNDEIMSKALSAQAAGKITARDVAVLESYFGRGMPAPANILAAIA